MSDAPQDRGDEPLGRVTIRECIAAYAMQGLLSHSGISFQGRENEIPNRAKCAVELADALLQALSEKRSSGEVSDGN